jgi:hypothetical protein
MRRLTKLRGGGDRQVDMDFFDSFDREHSHFKPHFVIILAGANLLGEQARGYGGLVQIVWFMNMNQ